MSERTLGIKGLEGAALEMHNTFGFDGLKSEEKTASIRHSVNDKLDLIAATLLDTPEAIGWDPSAIVISAIAKGANVEHMAMLRASNSEAYKIAADYNYNAENVKLLRLVTNNISLITEAYFATLEGLSITNP